MSDAANERVTRDYRAYLISTESGRLRMWHRRRRGFVPYFDSESPPYANVGRAFAAARRMRIDRHVEAVAICELARRYPDRFDASATELQPNR